MPERCRRWERVAALACALALASPSSVVLADGRPVAKKSGAVINFVNTKKLKVKKKVLVKLVCSVTCNVEAITTFKGPGINFTGTSTGQLQAGVVGGPRFQPNETLLKDMKEAPGKYKLVSDVTATDAVTGAVD